MGLVLLLHAEELLMRDLMGGIEGSYIPTSSHYNRCLTFGLRISMTLKANP